MNAPILQPQAFDAVSIVAWWHKYGKDPALMAQLRRCHSPREAACGAAFYRAREQLGRMAGNDLGRLALALTLVAHVKQDAPGTPVAVALAGRPTPRMHAQRFQRLLQVKGDDLDALHAHGVRLIRLLDARVNIRDLIWSFDHWNDDTRSTWAQHYYENIEIKED